MNALNRQLLAVLSRRFTLPIIQRNCSSALPDEKDEDKTLDDGYDVNGQLIRKNAASVSSTSEVVETDKTIRKSQKRGSSSLNLSLILEKGSGDEAASWYAKPSPSLFEKGAYETLDDNAPFEQFLRHSKFVQLGDPLGRIVVGKIAHVHKDNLYVDFGGKFNCVCKKPLFNPEQYAVGTAVRLKLQDLELSSRFLGSDTDMTLLEADATLVGLN